MKCKFSYLILFKILLAFLDNLQLHMNFRMFVNFYKEVSYDSDVDCTESVNQFGEYCHFNNVKSSNPRIWDVFYLLRSSLISFNVLYFSDCFILLVKFIPRYFNLSAIVNGIVFLIFTFELFITRNTIDFCILILYPATLLNLVLIIF